MFHRPPAPINVRFPKFDFQAPAAIFLASIRLLNLVDLYQLPIHKIEEIICFLIIDSNLRTRLPLDIRVLEDIGCLDEL